MTMQKGAVFVTGASRGIGRAAALALARDGFAVGVGYHASREAADEVCALVRSFGGDAEAFPIDVTDSASVSAAVAAAEARFGFLDGLVLSAGVADQRLLQDVDDETYAKIMETNLGGVFRTVRAALPGMIRRKAGSIVLVSSMWGQVGGSCEVVYSAAKAGVIGFCRALAKEVAPSGIRVNCVSPGVILTDMTKPLGEETLAALAGETPLGRNGTPEDVAGAIRFLLSPDAAFITGQVLPVNGGWC